MAKAYSFWVFDRHCIPIYHQDWTHLHFPPAGSGSGASSSSNPASFFQNRSASGAASTADGAANSQVTRRAGDLLPGVSRSVPNDEKVAAISGAAATDALPLDEEAKLVYGVVFSLRNMVRKLGGNDESFNSYTTSQYTLSHLHTPTYHTFVLITDPIPASVRGSGGGGGIPGTGGTMLKSVLLQIWRGPWIEAVARNSLSRGLERVESDEEAEGSAGEDGDEEREERERERQAELDGLDETQQKEKRKAWEKERIAKEMARKYKIRRSRGGINSDAFKEGVEKVLGNNKLAAPPGPS